MPDQISSLEQLVTAREQARETLKELHGLLKDCKAARKEIIDLLSKGAAVLVYESVKSAIEEATDKVAIHFDHATAEAIVVVNRRFKEVSSLVEEREEVLRGTVELVQSTANAVSDFLEKERTKNAR